MANTWRSGPAIAPRSQSLSHGAIAGAVVGSVLGGSIILLILGFVYFRYKRMAREAHAEEALSAPKAEPTSSSWQGVFPQQHAAAYQGGRPLSFKGESPRGPVPVIPVDSSSPSSLTTPHGEDWMRNNTSYPRPPGGDDISQQDFNNYSPSRQQIFPVTSEPAEIEPLDHASTAPPAANLSYYDMRISMESDPVQAASGPSRQMTDLYAEQRKAADEYRRKNSFPKRVWDSVTQRWSSMRSSTRTTGDGTQSPSDQNVRIKREPGFESPRDIDWQGQPEAPQIFQEPADMTENSAVSRTEGQQQQRRQRRSTRDTQYGERLPHQDSGIMESTERDPELPSSVIRSDSTLWLPHESPPGAAPPGPAQERLKSPEIPEPMDADGLAMQHYIGRQSPFSHSPRLPSESFVNPMAILHPTNAVEQDAYNVYQIKNSASPPAMRQLPPEIVTRRPTQQETIESPPPEDEDDDMGEFLDLPSDDDNRRGSSESYEYPMTPGQSSTAGYSSGRTPLTQPTVSPSPNPSGPGSPPIKHEPQSMSPPDSSKPLTNPAVLICPTCQRTFDQIHKLNHHKRYHDRSHECTWEGCDKKFGTKTHLDRHINDRHLKMKSYHCTEPSCPYFKGGKSFPRKDNWRRHMTKKHATTPQQLERMDIDNAF
ncbi:hypothetical protein GGR57DRAFT_253844 [Xylariaceae sp. FL1272]|nr:hypothetical protein GGR57DRAFT_253844 [Xylariaceae sp. FL1272]